MAKKTQKTHKGTKKVLNVRQSGSITVGHPGSRHNTGSKTSAFNRTKRAKSALSKADSNRLKRIIDTLQYIEIKEEINNGKSKKWCQLNDGRLS